MSDNEVTVLYFAWMREHTGTAKEIVSLPKDVAVIGDLLPHLIGKSSGHATALKNMMTVRVAVNRIYGSLQAPVAAGDEVAFFPPVTGG